MSPYRSEEFFLSASDQTPGTSRSWVAAMSAQNPARSVLCCLMLAGFGLAGCGNGNGETSGATATAASIATGQASGDAAATAPSGKSTESGIQPTSFERHDGNGIGLSRDAAGKAAFARFVQARKDGNIAEWESSQKDLKSLRKEALPALSQGLESNDPIAREVAASLIASLGTEGRDAAPALMLALRDESDYVRVNAAAALSVLGENAASVVPVLNKLLTSNEATIRMIAASSLGNYGPAAAESVPLLDKAAVDIDPEVCRAAAVALGRIGPAAALALPTLKRLASSTNEMTRTAALEAIPLIEKQGQ